MMVKACGRHKDAVCGILCINIPNGSPAVVPFCADG